MCSLSALRDLQHEGCGRDIDTARGAAECCISVETTSRVPQITKCTQTAHYLFYCDFMLRLRLLRAYAYPMQQRSDWLLAKVW